MFEFYKVVFKLFKHCGFEQNLKLQLLVQITSLLVEMNPRNMRLDLQTSDFERLKSAMDFPDAKSR